MEELEQLQAGINILIKYVNEKSYPVYMSDDELFITIDRPVKKDEEKILKEWGWYIGNYNNNDIKSWINCWVWG